MAYLNTLDGLPVVDAKTSLWLDVTKADIRLGKRKNPDGCAVARACKRTMKAKEVRVHLSRIYVRKASHWVRYIAPFSMRDAIIKFDRGKDFEPATYLMGRVQPSKATGKRQGSDKEPGAKKQYGRELKPFHTLTNVRPHATAYNAR